MNSAPNHFLQKSKDTKETYAGDNNNIYVYMNSFQQPDQSGFP